MAKRMRLLIGLLMFLSLLAACAGTPAATSVPVAGSGGGAVATSASASNTGGSPAATSAPTGNSGKAAAAGPDADGDGIPDAAEAVLGTDPQNADTDGDGQNDLADAAPLSAPNPIQETSTTLGFRINSIAVENNVDASGGDAPDHLELAVTNTGNDAISGFDIYTTLTDTATGDVQSFYQKLPDLTIAAGETTHLHFDVSGAPGHYRADPNNMFYRGQNALTVDVTLHAQGYAPQLVSTAKDAPGAEAGGD